MLNDWSCGGSCQTQHIEFVPPKRHPQSLTSAVDSFQPNNQSSVASAPAGKKLHKTLKRARPQQDIDGEERACVQRKKRRLSLDLVTSRLSRPYATPTTHIRGTKAWRAGAWARQRFAGGRLLRKAAILNFVAMKRKRGILDMSGDPSNYSNGQLSNLEDDVLNPERRTVDWRKNTAALPFHSDLARPLKSPESSTTQMPPTTASDYDVFDYELDEINDEEDQDSGDEDSEPIHSDFRQLDESDTEADFYDTSWSFATIEDVYEGSQKDGGKEIDLVMENESQDEISIAPVRANVLPAMFASV